MLPSADYRFTPPRHISLYAIMSFSLIYTYITLRHADITITLRDDAAAAAAFVIVDVVTPDIIDII